MNDQETPSGTRMMWNARVKAIWDRAHGTGFTAAASTRSFTAPLMPGRLPRGRGTVVPPGPSSLTGTGRVCITRGGRGPRRPASHQPELPAPPHGLVAARDGQ